MTVASDISTAKKKDSSSDPGERAVAAPTYGERASLLRQMIEEIDREMALLHARKRDAVVELARMAVDYP